jgi:hypothetical protein
MTSELHGTTTKRREIIEQGHKDVRDAVGRALDKQFGDKPLELRRVRFLAHPDFLTSIFALCDSAFRTPCADPTFCR